MKKTQLLILSILLLGIFIWDIPFVSALESMQIQEVTVADKSSTVTVEDLVYENNNISSGISFNQLSDFVTFNVVIKNDTEKNLSLEGITDNNEYLLVDSQNKGKVIKSGSVETIKVKVSYAKELINHNDITFDDFSFDLLFEDVSVLSNPLTTNNLFMLITIMVLITLTYYAVKNKKHKYLLLLLVLMPVFVNAVEQVKVSVSFDDVTVKGRFLEYRVQIDDGSGNAQEETITYGEPIGTLPNAVDRSGYDIQGWINQDNEPVTEETIVTEDLVITPNYEPIIYHITYNLNGGNLSTPNRETYTVEDEFTLNNPTLEGYTFSGWNEQGTGIIATSYTIRKGTIGDKVLNALYSANQDTVYTVIHRKMNLNGVYEEVEREELHGASGNPVSPLPRNYTGFKTPVLQTKTISGDGSTTFTYDYEREKYQFTVTDRTNLNSDSTANGEYFYGTTITVSAIEKTGYSFRWSDNNTEYSRTFTLETPTTLSTVYTANTNTQYKAIHKLMGFDENTYNTVDTVTLYGTTDDTVEVTPNTYQGFTSPQKKNVLIKGDGTAEVEFLYTRNKYQLTLIHPEYIETTTGTGEYYYDTEITLTAKDRTNYSFVKWSNESTINPITFNIRENTSMEAIYSKNDYIITFNYNGGVEGETIRLVDPTTAIGELPTSSLTNYYLDGWYTSMGVDGEKVTSSYVPTGNIELFARWKKSVEAMNIENSSLTIRKTEFANINITNASQIEETYTFTSNDESIATVNSNGKVTGVSVGYTTITITGDKSGKTKIVNISVLANEYIVTFNSNGGTVSQESKTVPYNSSIGTLPTGTRTNYYLDGWYTLPSGGEKVTESYVPTNDIEIYANWKVSVEAMTIEHTTLSVRKDDDVNINITNVNSIEETYTFESSNENIATVDNTGKVTGVDVGTATITIRGTKSNKTKTVTITVLTNQYLITFNSNGGTISQESKTISIGDPIGELPTGTRTNYYLDGWYTLPSGGDKITESYVPEDSIEIYAYWKVSVEAMIIENTSISVRKNSDVNINITNADSIEESYTFTSSNDNIATVNSNGKVTGVDVGTATITIRGSKSNKTKTVSVTVLPDQYLITFNNNGGTISQSSKTINAGNAIGELPTGTKTNYYLDGWYTLPSGGDKINESYVPDGDMDLYAYWKVSVEAMTISNTDIEIEVGEDETINITNSSSIEETYTFTSSDENVVSVDSTGKVTGVAEGTATITIRGSKSNKTKTVSVIVTTPQPTEYTITFNNNGGTISQNSKTINVGDPIGELPTGTRTNYYLDGWYTLPGGGDNITESYVPDGDMEIYAYWKVSVEAMTISNTELEIQEGKDETINITNAASIEETYTFESSDEDVATVDSTGKVTGVAEGTATITITGSKSNKTKAVSVTVTPAQVGEYVITFNPGDGTVSETTRNVTAGQAIGSLPTPTYNSSYSFDGWRLTSSEGTIIDATYVPTGDTTLYARWVPSDKVAEMDGEFYNTFHDAVVAVPTTGEHTIRLLKDDNSNIETIFSAGTVTIDLNGHTCKNTGNAVIKSFGTMTIKNGTMTCSAGQGAVNNNKDCTMVLDNVIVASTGSRQAVYNKGGDLTIQGNCTISTTSKSQRAAVHNLNDGTSVGTITIKDGTITSVNNFGLYIEGGTAEIGTKDGSIINTPVITGSTYGVAAYGTLSFYDGILKGKSGAIGNATSTGNSPTISEDTTHSKVTEIEDDTDYLEGTEGNYKTLSLEYTVPKYTVTLNANGGTVTPSSISVNTGSVIGSLPTPTYDEYHTFDGWYTTLDFNEEVTDTYEPSNSITIYAKWNNVAQYSISFNKNDDDDATGSMSNQIVLDSVSTKLLENQYAREGYAFVGWNTESNGSGTSYLDEENITLSSNITLYAQWVKTYTLSFVNNNTNATGDLYSVSLISGVSTQLPNKAFNAYIYDPQKIVSYNSNDVYDGISYYKNQNISITQDTSVYALWDDREITETIYWALQDNDSNGSEEKLVISNSEVSGSYSGSFSGDTIFTDPKDVPWIDYKINGTSSFWYVKAANVTNVEIQGHVVPLSTAYWFELVGNYANSVSLDLSNLDVSNVISMNSMFYLTGYYSESLSISDISNWDVSSVRNMSWMFASLGSNASNFNLSNISNWDTSAVTNMEKMFSSFKKNVSDSPVTIDLSKWDVSRVQNMTWMFSEFGSSSNNCRINGLSNWDTSSLNNTNNMFYNICSSSNSITLDISNWNTSHINNISSMFRNYASSSSKYTVIIPRTNGNNINNTSTTLYGESTSVYTSLDDGRLFTFKD